MHLFLHMFSFKMTSHLGAGIVYFLGLNRWPGPLRACLVMAVLWAGLGRSDAQAQSSTIRYVTPQGAGNQSGTNWANALPGTTLQAAINASRASDQVWVARGVYKPTAGSDSTKSFTMQPGVAIYGGFVGTETSLDQRPVIAPVAGTPSSSTLSGDIGRLGDNTDNSFHVIYNPASLGLTSTAILDGFVITGGNARRSSSPDNSGGGIYNNGSGSVCSPQIRHCTFVANSAAGLGGAMFNDGKEKGNSSPSLTNCAFVSNTSAYLGGAIYNTGQNGISSPTLINCAFMANTASNYGGAMVNEGTEGVSSPNLINCTFLANSGGAMYNPSFKGNSSPRLINCVLFGNGGTNTFSNSDGGSVTASYSLFDSTVTGYTDGGNNRTTTTSPFASLTSVALNTCGPAINVGSNQAYTDAGGPQTDLAGNPRIYPSEGRIDLGAVESQEIAQPIAFIQQPPSASAVNVGGRVEIPVRVTGSVLAYQWYKDGQTVSGQTSATFSLDYIQTTDAGRYSVEVTGGCNSLTSTAFNLTVIRLIPIAGLSVSPNSVVDGQPITFSATLDNLTETYSYTLTNGLGSILTGTSSSPIFSQTLTARGSGSQTYTLTVATQYARGSSSVDLTVTPDPAVANGPACTDFTNRTTANAGFGRDFIQGVYALGNVVYVATGGGLSISYDGGQSFNTSSLVDYRANGVYAVGQTVYVATDGGGLSISIDGGQTFTNRTTNNGLGNIFTSGVYALGNVVYVATDNGLSISIDGGQTFTNRTTANAGFGSNIIHGVYALDNVVYVATDNGLSISYDGGQSFNTNKTTANAGFGSNIIHGVYAVDNVVYVATNNGLSISYDGGQSFNTNKTTDNGLGDNKVNGVYAVGQTVYATTNNGLSISIDGGKQFFTRRVGDGLGSDLVNGVYALGDRLYAATSGGLSYCSSAPPAPTLANLLASPNPVMAGQPTTFTATVENVTGVYNFTLSNGVDTSLSGTASGPFSQSLTAQGSGTQSFTLTIGTEEGVVTATTALTVVAPPLTLTGLAANPNPVITGQPVLFTATVGGVTAPYSYTLSDGLDMPLSGTALGTSFSQRLTAQGSGVQTFTLTVAAENGTAKATTDLSVLAPSSGLTITGFRPTQERVTGKSVGFTATLTGLLDSDAYSFTLTNGRADTPPLIARFQGPDFDQSVPVEGSGPQTYTLTVASQKGNASATASIIVAQETVTLVRFAMLGVTPVGCEVVSGGERQVRFTPQYVGTNGEPISFSVVNELAPTTSPGPYSLRLYTDNPTITLVASQGGRGEVRFIYNWLAACQGAPTPPQAPVSTGIPSQTLQQGQAYQLVLTDYVTDPDGQTPQFTVQGLPARLNLSEGLISGTPSTTGTYPVSVTATDPGGLFITVSFTLAVVPAPSSSSFALVGTSPVSCVLVDPIKQGYRVSFTPQYEGLTGQPISFSVVNELSSTTTAGPYTLRLYADNPVITLKATQAGSLGEASFRYNWLTACGVEPVNPGSFKLVGVTTVNCESVGSGQRRVSFTPQYAGRDGSPVSFSVVNELGTTTEPGPYRLTLYLDNPTITLTAQQGAMVATYRYDWLAACPAQPGGRLGTGVDYVSGLHVRVLGNPIGGSELVTEVTGAEGLPLLYELTDSQGRILQRHQVTQAGRVERQHLPIGNQPAGLLLLRVSSPTQSQTIKLVKEN